MSPVSNKLIVQQLNFKVGEKSFGLRSGPRGQIIFVENLARGEYQRIASYSVMQDYINLVMHDIAKWIVAECGLTLSHETAALMRRLKKLLDLLYEENSNEQH